MILPSGNCAAPSRTRVGALMVVNELGDAGFQTSAGCGCCHPSQKMKLPLSIKMELIATTESSGARSTGPAALGWASPAESEPTAGPVPVASVAATVNV